MSTLWWKWLLYITSPEVLHKAQAEIDSIVGNERLPTFSDREHLPYLNAVLTESLRWNSVAPTGQRCFILTAMTFF